MIQYFYRSIKPKNKLALHLLSLEKTLFTWAGLFSLLLFCSLSAFAEITFEWRDLPNKKGLKVTITTERLTLISTSPEDIPSLTRLYQDPIVMHHFRNGQLWTTEYAEKRANTWISRWESNDPRGSFSVFLRGDSQPYMGNAVLGVGDEPGRSEMAYLFFSEFWHQGYAFEAISILVNEYAPLLVAMDYDFGMGFPNAKKTPFLWIDATVGPENTASFRILDKLGFTHRNEDLPLIKKGEPIPEQCKNYNQEVELGEPPVTYVRTVEEKFGVTKWHFTKQVGSKNAEFN